MGHVLNYLALITLSTRAAVFVAAIGALNQCTFRSRQRNAARTWFSVAGISIAMYLSGLAYVGLGGRPGAWDVSTALVPFAVATTAFFMANSGFVAVAIGLSTTQSFAKVWSETFLSTWPGYLLGATMAGAGIFAMQQGAVWLVILLGVPFALSFHNMRALLERTDEAATDGLTGLPNHRFVVAHAARELDRAKREGLSLTLIVGDLDGFKTINDRYGHRIGDRALRQVARRLQEVLGGLGVCARYGGDEFLVVLSECGSGDGGMKARDLQCAVSTTNLGLSPPRAAYMSVGTATFPEDGDSLERLFEVADARMYCDKRERDRSQRAEQAS